jgi:hypothetical protein
MQWKLICKEIRQPEFPKWTEVLGDEQMTAALLDLLTHNANILNISGESFRFKQALAKHRLRDIGNARRYMT